MANYWSPIPAEVPSLAVFETVNSHTLGGMDGIAVSAFGDHALAGSFDPRSEEVFKFCQSRSEICEKVATASAVGNLQIRNPTGRTTIHRPHKSPIPEDDCSISKVDIYEVQVTLINPAEFGKEDAVFKSYENRLGILLPVSGNRFSMSYGETNDLHLFYHLKCSDAPKFFNTFEAANSWEWFGDIQEKLQLQENPVDPSRYPHSHSYSVYSNFLKDVCNYPSSAKDRFCSLLDNCPENLNLSVGQRYLSFKTGDGRQTRTLRGNQFDIHHQKGRRKLSISFEQYSDNDVPVKTFAGAIRKSLKQLGINI